MILRIFILILTLVGLLQAGESKSEIVEKKGKSGIELTLTEYDWEGMWNEYSLRPKITTCKPKNINKGILSFAEATISEPLYLVDVSIKKGEIKAFNAQILKDASKTGTARGDGGVYVNMIKIPLMNMLLKNTTKGMLVFEKGYMKPVYLGVLDPKKWDNILASDVAPERKIFASIKGQLAAIVSCLSYASLDLMPRRYRGYSTTGNYIKDTIDPFYYAVGCLGPVPTGTSTTHFDPISNGILAASSIFTDMFTRKGVISEMFAKHTTKNVLNGHSKEIVCRGMYHPIFPQSAYTQQLIYPTTTKNHELGIPPAEYNFHGVGESGKLVEFIFSQRRDYATMAYQD